VTRPTSDSGIAFLYDLQLFGVKLGLRNMEALCAELGHPERNLRFIHIAGTNGKGSVASALESVLRSAGYRAGLYTSPHLVSFRERIRVDGDPVSEVDLATGMEEIKRAVLALRSRGMEATFFEAATALAFWWFQRAGADPVVLETGMGGRLDATNVVRPLLCLLTPVAMDHEAWLGPTLGAIAGEKAGILKPGVPALSTDQETEPRRVFSEKARELGIPLTFVPPLHSRGYTRQPLRQQVVCGEETVAVSYLGRHQLHNLALVVAAARLLPSLGVALPGHALSDGLARAAWPGRFQVVDEDPLFVLDGAHNPAGAAAALATWREIENRPPGRILFGMLRDKDAATLVAQIDRAGMEVWLVPIDSGRALEPAAAAALFKHASVRRWDSLPEAWAVARSQPHPDGTLAMGSLYLIGEILTLLDPQGSTPDPNG
jgi:dihydrofolate synthase/folylpolyglutamate synthase